MRKRRVILFEDDEKMLRLYSDMFLMKGYDVLAYSEPFECPIHAENAASAPHLNPCADILVTDYRMPRVNGLELLMAQSAHGCRLPVKNKALISGFLQGDVLQKVSRLGCAVFEKPLDIVSFHAWIAECEERMDLSQPLAVPRKEERYFFEREVPCLVTIGNKTWDVLVINSSRSGLCLKLAMPPARAENVRIQTQLSITSPTAAVRWVNELPDGSYLAGLQFS